MKATRLYRVHEVLEQVGISRRALRVYEEVGLVVAAEEEDGTPLYAEEALEACGGPSGCAPSSASTSPACRSCSTCEAASRSFSGTSTRW